jgi:hypothetical protein
MYKIINAAILAVLLIAVSFLSYFFYQSQSDQATSKSYSTPKPIAQISQAQSEPSASSSYVTPDQLAQEIDSLKNYLNQSLATISAIPAPTTTIISSTPSPSQQTSYITMGNTYATTSMTWVDVPGSEVYIDLLNDYSQDAYITWSASLKVAHANGQAFARLYDATNKIAVAGSEITTTNNATYTQKTSGQLALWRGNNLYRVQIKSLNSFEVAISGGKLKITY